MKETSSKFIYTSGYSGQDDPNNYANKFNFINIKKKEINGTLPIYKAPYKYYISNLTASLLPVHKYRPPFMHYNTHFIKCVM